jgi:hypothetical protein
VETNREILSFKDFAAGMKVRIGLDLGDIANRGLSVISGRD